jgi:hypothetical protein
MLRLNAQVLLHHWSMILDHVDLSTLSLFINDIAIW